MAESLRELLVERKLVEEILDFGGAQLFGATNYTAILVLDAAGDGAGLRYRKLLTTGGDAVAEIEEMEPSEFAFSDLGGAPWILAAPSERRILEAAQRGAAALGDLTSGIFTGLQTSADAIYIVEDLGPVGALRRVRSKASNRVLELEPDLLHPLASGGDVQRYAFAPIRQLLLFPYHRKEDGEMDLVPWDQINELPHTADYLQEHEEPLRGRERGKMDHDRWYAYVYPKSLGRNDSVKLGVPRLCERLRSSADPDGRIYLDNVDVNGIIASEDGPSVWELVVLLNSRLLDFLFRLRTVPFRGDFMSANKQFISPLPIKLPEGDRGRLTELGKSLHGLAAEIGSERTGFLDWLEDQIGADPRSLPGKTVFAAYDSASAGDLLTRLRRLFDRVIKVDPSGRAFRDRFSQEHSASIEKLSALRRELTGLEAEADRLVYDAYSIVDSDRQLVDSRYRSD